MDSDKAESQSNCKHLLICFWTGEYMTTAQWMRHFVQNHPEYKHDSAVSDSIAYDLLLRCDKIEKGEVTCHQLFGMPKHKSEYVLPTQPSSSDGRWFKSFCVRLNLHTSHSVLFNWLLFCHLCRNLKTIFQWHAY